MFIFPLRLSFGCTSKRGSPAPLLRQYRSSLTLARILALTRVEGECIIYIIAEASCYLILERLPVMYSYTERIESGNITGSTPF